MTQNEIIRMAREAGFIDHYIGGMKYELERFAALVAYKVGTEQYKAGYAAGKRDEREACAKVCDDIGDSDNGYGCAAAIRARSE